MDMSAATFVKQNQLGVIAKQWLQKEQSVTVFGVTSGGIFVHLGPSYQTIYLTNYPDYGPINVNLTQVLPQQWQTGKKFQLYFDQCTLAYQDGSNHHFFSELGIWKNQPARPFNVSEEEFMSRIKKASQQLFLIKGDHGFTRLLSQVYAPDSVALEPGLAQVWENIQQLRTCLVGYDASAFLRYAKHLISYGRGLTPSGDDFLCGLIYCLRRKAAGTPFAGFLNEVKPGVLSLAAQLTTSISTSLLDGCFVGEAHSRIEAMTEALTAVEVPLSNQALRMAGWGSSSGADTTLGIMIAGQVLFDGSGGRMRRGSHKGCP